MEVGGRQELVEKYLDQVLELENDIELVEVKVTGRGPSTNLRVYLYKPSGITVDDCARISRRLSRELDHEPELQTAFTIEVSSPGLDRKLQTDRDFERAVGEILTLKVENEGGKLSTIIGRLAEVTGGTLLLDTPPEKRQYIKRIDGGGPIRIPISSIREGSIEVPMP